MPNTFKRTTIGSLVRGSVDAESGEFSMVLASEGEASDGHILSVSGGQLPRKMPMQIAHSMSPTATLGSITQMRKDKIGETKVVRAKGQIELDGAPGPAGVRQDLLHMIERGHVSATSIQWEGIEAIPRTELPEEHPFHVEREEKDFRKRFGLFFKKWRALEGSIVAVGADREALIGRAQETQGEESIFWRGMAAEAQQHADARLQEEAQIPEPENEAPEEIQGTEELAVEPYTVRDALGDLVALVQEIREMGGSDEQIIEAMTTIPAAPRDETNEAESLDDDEQEETPADTRADGVPGETAADGSEALPGEEGRENPDSRDETAGEQMGRILREELAVFRTETLVDVKHAIDKRMGRIK